MSEQEIKDNNTLIAEFMGVDFGKEMYSWRPGVLQPLTRDHLNYHKSWGWLMPVVEKIEQHGCIVEIWLSLGKGCRIIKGSFKAPLITIANTESNSTIEAVYLAVVEFIKWHNNQKNEENEEK